jgi:uncharacterized heparinase superfamily protein
MANWRETAVRWWHVLRYYRASQLAMRLVSIIRRSCWRWTGGIPGASRHVGIRGLRGGGRFAELLGHALASRRANGAASQAHAILQSRFCFFNEERALPNPVDWRLQGWPEATDLWRFRLHCHEFLLDLASEGLAREEPIWSERAWQLVADWIEHNRPTDRRALSDAWHPYCISRRLPVWMILFSATPPPDSLCDRVLESMISQASFLSGHLEWDLRGNHLLENVKALVLSGTFFDGPLADRWLEKGAETFRQQLVEQILPHGEHFERSPMYHALILEAILDVRDAVQDIRPELRMLCAETAGRMARFLEATLHPDGGIPLLGDACFGQSALPSQLVARAKEGDDAAAVATGDYWVYRHDDDFLIFDAGPVGPDHLPAHAHADLLGIEASVGRRRLFVDGGVFDYENSPMRRYCRSSAAHNVLQIDDRDQCDMWSRFRMGRRGWPSRLVAGDSGGFRWARATHNAYRHLRVPAVGRWIACRPGGPWFCVDWAHGQGVHQLTSRLHLHPEVDVQQTASDEVRILCGARALHWRLLRPGDLSVTTGWYCPEFGRRVASAVLEYRITATLPAVCGWYLTWNAADEAASLEQPDAGKVVLRWTRKDDRRQFRPLEMESAP